MFHLLFGRRQDTKNPTSRRGFQIGRELEVYRARQTEAPDREAFFTAVSHSFVIMDTMMRRAGFTVNFKFAALIFLIVKMLVH